MTALADLERLLERVFERTTARLFRARIQIVQVERKVERAMERARVPQGTRTVVPSRYRVRLHPDDLGSLASQAGSPEELAGTLADAALSFARAHGYHVGGRPSVALVADPGVDRGVVEVDAIGDPRTAPAPQPGPNRSAVPPMPVPDVPVVRGPGTVPPPAKLAAFGTAGVGNDGQAASTGPALDHEAAAGPHPAQVPDAPAAIPDLEPYPVSGGIRGDGTRTMVFRRPAPDTARAVLRVFGPAGGERTVQVDGVGLTVGRARDNGLVLDDTRVSRHHGRLQTRRGTLVYTDLGSTNGSRVNGIRVDECALGVGDRLLLGDTVLLVEQLPG